MWRARWALGIGLVIAAMGAGPAALSAAPKLPVVAAEELWGSIARELGGDRVEVTSLVADPATAAHDYEPRPSDGVAVARAKVAVVNGIGYDVWMSDLLAANPSSGRKVVDVGEVVGVDDGGNPHQWYAPGSVDAVIDAVTAAFTDADPAGAGYYAERRHVYRTERLKRYDDLRARIRAEYGGVPVGASESIFVPLAEDLGLDLVTPASFMDALAHGNEPTARDKATVDRQIVERRISVFVYNEQNSTPDVEALVDEAEEAGVPVVAVTETPVPEGTAFADWQADQLQRLAEALAEGTGGAAAPERPAEQPAAGRVEPDGGPAGWLVALVGAAFLLAGLGAGAAALRRHHGEPAPGA